MWGWLRNHNGSIVLCLRRFSKRRPRRILAEVWGQGKRRSGLLLLCPEPSEGTLPSQPDQCQGCSCALLCLNIQHFTAQILHFTIYFRQFHRLSIHKQTTVCYSAYA